MLTLAIILIGTGLLIAAIAGIWMLVLAFQRHILWGLAYLCVPFSQIVFLIYAWKDAKRPFFSSLFGLAVCVLGVLAMPENDKGAMAVLGRFGEEAEKSDESPAANGGAQSATEDAQAKLAVLKTREADLLRRKAALKPDDRAAAEELTRDINAYNAELQPLLHRVAQPASAR